MLSVMMLAVTVTGCSMGDKPSATGSATQKPDQSDSASQPASGGSADASNDSEITLGFAGDIHFERQLASHLRHPRTALNRSHGRCAVRI